jgi:hypothetical protein
MTLKIEWISGERRARIRLSGEFRSAQLDQVNAEIEHARGQSDEVQIQQRRWHE